MRHTKLFILGTFLAGMASILSCSEDKGNYDYTFINEVTIDSINQDYTKEAGSTFKIEPVLTFSEKEKNEFSYSWTIGELEVSTDKVLDITLPPLNFGAHLCALTVKDKGNGMQYRRTFTLNIVNPFNWGYYFFTKKDNGDAEMAYIKATKDIEPTMSDVKYTSGIGDYKFGKEPVQIEASFGYDNSLKDYYWTMTFLTKEGENPAIVTNNGNFLPTTLINKENFIEQNADYIFKPECTTSDRRRNQFFISNGQFISYKSGKLYRPAKHQGKYYWSNPVYSYAGYLFYWVYDTLSKQYYIIQSYRNDDPTNGIYADSYAYDQVVPPAKNRPLEGKILYASTSLTDGETAEQLTVYTAASNGIHTYTWKYASDVASFNSEQLLPMNNLNDQTAFALGKGIAGNSWYISSGNEIYYSPVISPKISKWASLPSNLGNIESIGFSALGSRMVAVLYDENSSEERKGSVVYVDVETKKVTHTFPHILHHCVSYFAGNSDGFEWGDYGDGK